MYAFFSRGYQSQIAVRGNLPREAFQRELADNRHVVWLGGIQQGQAV